MNLISKTNIVIFCGAISTKDNQASYTMTSDLYLYNMAQNFLKKLETSNSYKPPNVRYAHESLPVKDGGSKGNGHYITDDLITKSLIYYIFHKIM